MKKDKRNKGNNRAKFEQRKKRAAELIFPTSYAQYANIALEESDLNSNFCKNVAPYNNIGTQNFFWTCTWYGADIVQGVNDLLGSMVFTLSQCAGNGDWATCFDQFKMRGVTMRFEPRVDKSAFTPNQAKCPRLWTKIDYDDASTEVRDQIIQSDATKETPPGAGVVRAFVPHIAVPAYQSGGFNAYKNEYPDWLDMAYAQTQHFGIKYVIEGGLAMQTILQSYAVSGQMFWEFKSAR